MTMPQSGWTILAFIYFALVLLHSASVLDLPFVKSIVGFFSLTGPIIAPFFFFLILGRISELKRMIEESSIQMNIAATADKQPETTTPPETSSQESPTDQTP